MERQEREPPRRSVVIQLADALDLQSIERYNFVVSAGYAPDELIYIDPSAVMIGQALDSPGLTESEKSELRGVILTLADHWIRLGEVRMRQ